MKFKVTERERPGQARVSGPGCESQEAWARDQSLGALDRGLGYRVWASELKPEGPGQFLVHRAWARGPGSVGLGQGGVGQKAEGFDS